MLIIGRALALLPFVGSGIPHSAQIGIPVLGVGSACPGTATLPCSELVGMFIDNRCQKITRVGRYELIAGLLDLLWDGISQRAFLACQRAYSDTPLNLLQVID